MTSFISTYILKKKNERHISLFDMSGKAEGKHATLNLQTNTAEDL